jgi:hypothetical protein
LCDSVSNIGTADDLYIIKNAVAGYELSPVKASVGIFHLYDANTNIWFLQTLNYKSSLLVDNTGGTYDEDTAYICKNFSSITYDTTSKMPIGTTNSKYIWENL